MIDGLQHGKPHAAAVDQPAAEQHLDHLLDAVDQLRIGLGAVVPVGRRDRQAPRNGLAADLEHAVELGDAAGAHGMPGLHALGRLQQAAGFGQQTQPRQIRQQAAQHVLEAARGDDPLRAAAPAQRHVQERLPVERL